MNELFNTWKSKINEDSLLKEDFLSIKNSDDISNRFFKELEFGTGGLRGLLGFGINRMNKYVIRRATLGLVDTLKQTSNKNLSVSIAFDSRNYSKEFAREVALTLATHSITVHIMKDVAPTPLLSFMVRKLKCDAGIVITASHNPKEYNGYKVYGNDGGQITLDMANAIYKNMHNHDYFEKVKDDYAYFVNNKKIIIHDEDVSSSFIDSTLKQSLYDPKEKEIKILYTALNGVGYKYVSTLFNKKGYTYKVIEQQINPDGNFPTCPKPNPELYETMKLGMNKLKELNYDVLFATDPDADRCGVAVNSGNDVRLFTGDEVGLLLVDFVYRIKKENGTLSKNPIVIKTIATTDLIHIMSTKYNFKVIDTLTGFKFIGEQVEKLVNENRSNDFLIGVEDSCGYLTNKDVRDKDSINAALLIAEMTNYYKNKGMSLLDRLNQIYDEFGHYYSCLKFIELEGEKGLKKIYSMMDIYRSEVFYNSFLDCVGKYDYKLQKGFGIKSSMTSDLPKSDVIKFYFKDKSVLLVRPSGTEPKIKFYYLIPSKEKELQIEEKLNSIL